MKDLGRDFIIRGQTRFDITSLDDEVIDETKKNCINDLLQDTLKREVQPRLEVTERLSKTPNVTLLETEFILISNRRKLLELFNDWDNFSSEEKDRVRIFLNHKIE